MENASKALEMAFGVLISVLILSILIIGYLKIVDIQKQKDLVEESNNISKYNDEWAGFQKNMTYGVDVLSAINKAITHNEKYKDNLQDYRHLAQK